jgi:hypothetical protein
LRRVGIDFDDARRLPLWRLRQPLGGLIRTLNVWNPAADRPGERTEVEGVQLTPDALANRLLLSGGARGYGIAGAAALPTFSSPPTSSQIWRWRVSGMKSQPTTAVITETAMV